MFFFNLFQSEIKNQYLENELNNLNTKLNLLKTIEFEKEAIEKQYNLNRILCENLTNKNNELEKVFISNKNQIDSYKVITSKTKQFVLFDNLRLFLIIRT
jgi:hypothetical protein